MNHIYEMENYFNKIIALFVKSDVSPACRDEFHRWLAKEKFSVEKEEALHRLWDNMGEGASAEVPTQTRQSLQAVHRKIRQRARTANAWHLRFWQVSAACLLIALLSTLYFTSNKTPVSADLIEQYAPIAEMTHLVLPDGTEVQMNSTTTLLYPAQFNGESRSVYLIGEANFKVAKNEKQPFIVKSDDFQVTALGTEFNMKVYPGDPALSATLLSGSVEVRFNDLSAGLVLEPNEQFTYNKQTKEESVGHPDMDEVTAWQRGELIFKSTTLKEIITVLERKYPYSFIYALSTLKDDKYTFRFKDNTSLREVMDIITKVSGNTRYRIENDKCYILPL